MSATAAQAEQTAAQAEAAAAAFDAAFAATVPPPLIAANRAQLAVLVATSILGQNTPAIAATEAQYFQMWAQDAAAMYSYAGASAAATELSPFTTPQQAAAQRAGRTGGGRHASGRHPGQQHLATDFGGSRRTSTIVGSQQPWRAELLGRVGTKCRSSTSA